MRMHVTLSMSQGTRPLAGVVLGELRSGASARRSRLCVGPVSAGPPSPGHAPGSWPDGGSAARQRGVLVGAVRHPCCALGDVFTHVLDHRWKAVHQTSRSSELREE